VSKLILQLGRTIGLGTAMAEESANIAVAEKPAGLLDEIRMHLSITQGVEIARRYFAMNAFDGLLPILGIIVGGFLSMSHQPASLIYQTSLLAILATSSAMLVSGITSSYLTEGAERKRDLEELEQSMLADLRESLIWKASRTTTVVVSIINGFSPFATALIAASPLALVAFGVTIEFAFLLSILIGLGILFVLGLFLGYVSRSNMIIYGIKTVSAGIAIVILTYFFSTMVG
jgi:predicted membrane protein (TIGR00267 family)